jgi:hypothetical protein
MIRVNFKDGGKLMVSDSPEAVTFTVDGKEYDLSDVTSIMLFEPDFDVIDSTAQGRDELGNLVPVEITAFRFLDTSDVQFIVPMGADLFEHAIKTLAGKLDAAQIETFSAIPAALKPKQNGGA